MTGITCGSTRWAWNRSRAHPVPNANRSACTFESPHPRRVSIVHAPAFSMAGVPVNRGP